MRTLRSVLTVAAATVAFAGATTGAASAAPPVGCYGFPSIPDAFVCVTSFTPENAVPGATVDPDDSSVTIPEFCAGECYGPFVVPVAGVDVTPTGGALVVVVYKGQTYVVDGGVPPVPPVPPVDVPPVPDVTDDCHGQRSLVLVCYTAGPEHDLWRAVVCVAGTCELVVVPYGYVRDGVWEFVDDTRP